MDDLNEEIIQVETNEQFQENAEQVVDKITSFIDLVDIIQKEDRFVTHAWSNSPDNEFIITDKSIVPVSQGQNSYQLSTGEIIKL